MDGEKAFVTEISHCELCGNKDIPTVIDLGLQPLCDDLIEKGSHQSVQKYPTEICYCPHCFTAHQRFQIAKEALFKPSYHYRAHLTKDVLTGMKDFVESCAEMTGALSNKKVIDIGCNDGSLLSIFKEHGCLTMGVEPTDAIDEAVQIDHPIKGFFDHQTVEQCKKQFSKPDLVTFTNVFAHIENLGGVLENLKNLCAPETLLVIENHYLGSVLSQFQFDTFYHEHPRTYSFESFKTIARTLGMKIVKVQFPSRYGGNIRVFMSKNQKFGQIENKEIERLYEIEKQFESKIETIQTFIQHWPAKFKKQLRQLQAEGRKIAGKAFPARASIIINLLDIDKNTIAQILEQPGSPKLGHLVPGTDIEIVSDEFMNNYDVIINFAWHIHEEITRYLEGAGFKGEIIPVLSIDRS